MPLKVTDGTKYKTWIVASCSYQVKTVLANLFKKERGGGGAQGHAIRLCLNTQSVASGRLHRSSEQRTKQTAHQLHYGT